jgi:hypothetical protein
MLILDISAETRLLIDAKQPGDATADRAADCPLLSIEIDAPDINKIKQKQGILSELASRMGYPLKARPRAAHARPINHLHRESHVEIK